MRVYLDNCCYNRPFDDQNQLKILIESLAKLSIQRQMRDGTLEYAWSSVLDYEVGKSKLVDRAEQIKPWKHGAIANVLVDDSIRQRARELEALGVKPMDALHVACAESANCDWFLTTDRDLVKKTKSLSTLRIANPVDFIGAH